MTQPKNILDRLLSWIGIKHDIHTIGQRPRFFKRGEVWWCHLGQNIGDEENGKHENFKRPVVILRKFNSNLILVVPTSTILKEKNYWYIPFRYHGNTYSALASHIRTIDTKRLGEKITTLGTHVFEVLLESIQEKVFKIEPPKSP